MKGFKKAIIIGCPTSGSSYLPECVNDGVSTDHYLKTEPSLVREYGGFKTMLITDPVVEFKTITNDVLKWMLADNPSGYLFYYSSHGFRERDKTTKKVYSGLYPGTPWLHSELYKQFFVPLLNTNKPLIRVYDCCYAKTSKKLFDIKAVDSNSTEINLPKVKSIDLDSTLSENDVVSEIPEYTIGKYNNDCVIGACQTKQVAWGQFVADFGSQMAYSTQGHSLFTWLFWGALYARCNHLKPDLMRKDLIWRNVCAMDAVTPYKEFKNGVFNRLVPEPFVTCGKDVPWDFFLPW